MPNYKPLFIANPKIPKDDSPGKWHEFQQLNAYIQGIQTIDIDTDSVSIQDLISGIPTPWARARIFQYAFIYTADSVYQSEHTGLIDYYQYLLQEWRGFLALLALSANRISVSEPVFLDPELKDHENLFAIRGALGRMLFEDQDLWYIEEKKQPGLQLIYYQNQLIGATSPFTLVFTAQTLPPVLSKDISWARGNHLEDPLKNDLLNEEELKKLYLFIENIKSKIQSFNNTVNRYRSQNKINHDSLAAHLTEWLNAIKTSLQNKRIAIPSTSIPLDSMLKFAPPYYEIFNKKVRPYALGHRLTLRKPEGSQSYEAIEIDPQALLLQGDYLLKLDTVNLNEKLDDNLATLLLKVEDKPNAHMHYFALPLSKLGLILFQDILADILKDLPENHQLRAKYNAKENIVTVELILLVDNAQFPSITREYKVETFATAPNLILWPNFIAADWQLYYLYSECPSNDFATRAKPYFWQANGRLLKNSAGELVIFGNHQTIPQELEVKRLIHYPSQRADSGIHRYEIIRSNIPIAGVALYEMISGEETLCGFLPLKKPIIGSSAYAIQDFNNKHINSMLGAKIGIDFGSNNTCISYSISGADIKPLRLKNRRLFLLGKEFNTQSSSAKIAYPNELFFFQRHETRNGQLKSWVHSHNQSCIVSGMHDVELAGGIPVLEPYLQIEDVTEEEVTGRKYMRTNVGLMYYELKWKNDLDGMNLKKGFLKTLWLKICADLFEAGAVPQKLVWAYPGALSEADKRLYAAMYDEIAALQPFPNFHTEVQSPKTEAQAVCNYAFSKGGFALTGDNLMVGIDVGGSTSDILIVGNYQNKVQLLRQCSVRAAANRLAVAFKNLKAIRQAFQYFIESENSPLRLPAQSKEITNSPQKIPYYLNLIFDRLTTQDLDKFYRFFAMANAPGLDSRKVKTVFILPAYLSGLILFYSGMAVRNTLEYYQLSQVTRIKAYPFGKGGRIFSWLKACGNQKYAQEFYNSVFSAGFTCIGKKEGFRLDEFQLESADRPDNKSEVAFGLTAREEVTQAENNLHELIGEEGWLFENQTLDSSDSILPIHLKNLQASLNPPQQMKNLSEFLSYFFKLIGPEEAHLVELEQIKLLKEKLPELKDHIKNYICYDSEYNYAQQKENFDYRQSLFILESLCFLDRFVIPNYYKD
jgi:hypothetical protein